MPVRLRLGQWVVAAIVVLLALRVVQSLAVNPNIKWPVVGSYLTSGQIMHGLATTLVLACVSMLVAVIVGTAVGICATSTYPTLRALALFYTWFFRAVPLLVQLLVWGNFALLFKYLEIGIPFTGRQLVHVDTNTIITGFVASILGLALHEAAYIAEIVRGAIASIDHGQHEAAFSLGLSRRKTLQYVLLPQTLRLVVPPFGNQFISLLKASSLVSVIGGGDLLTVAENIAASNYRTIEMLFVASFWYLVIVSATTLGQTFLERRLDVAR